MEKILQALELVWSVDNTLRNEATEYLRIVVVDSIGDDGWDICLKLISDSGHNSETRMMGAQLLKTRFLKNPSQKPTPELWLRLMESFSAAQMERLVSNKLVEVVSLFLFEASSSHFIDDFLFFQPHIDLELKLDLLNYLPTVHEALERNIITTSYKAWDEFQAAKARVPVNLMQHTAKFLNANFDNDPISICNTLAKWLEFTKCGLIDFLDLFKLSNFIISSAAIPGDQPLDLVKTAITNSQYFCGKSPNSNILDSGIIEYMKIASKIVFDMYQPLSDSIKVSWVTSTPRETSQDLLKFTEVLCRFVLSPTGLVLAATDPGLQVVQTLAALVIISPELLNEINLMLLELREVLREIKGVHTVEISGIFLDVVRKQSAEIWFTVSSCLAYCKYNKFESWTFLQNSISAQEQ